MSDYLRTAVSDDIAVVDTCLFRVLPPMQKLNRRPLSLSAGVIKTGEDSFFSCEAEKLGQKVLYGNQVVLFQLVARKAIKAEYDKGGVSSGSREVMLTEDLAHPSALCEIAPVNNLTRYYDNVNLSQPFHLYFSDANFIRYELSSDPAEDQQLIVSLSEFAWEASVYEQYAEDRDSLLHYGSIVTIGSQKMWALLTAKPLAGEPYDLLPSVEKQEEELNGGFERRLPACLQGDFALELTFELRDCGAYWTFEKENRFEGGPIARGEKFWVKHVATQRYIGADGHLTREKTESNSLCFPPSSSASDDDQTMRFASTLQFQMGENGVLVPMREQSPKFVWSALFSKHLQTHEDQRHELYQPAGFMVSGARKEDVDFEVNQPEEHISEMVLWTLCFRPTFSEFRLIYRHLDANIKLWQAPDFSLAGLSAKVKNLQLSYQKVIVFLAEHPHLEELGNICFAMGYQYDLMEGLINRKFRTDEGDNRSFKLTAELEESARYRLEVGLVEVLDCLSGIRNDLSEELLPLLMNRNAYVCTRVIEDETFFPEMLKMDVLGAGKLLDCALQATSLSAQKCYEYIHVFHAIVCSGSGDAACVRLLSKLVQKIEGGITANPRDLLYQSVEGERSLIASFNGQPDAPAMVFLGQELSFFPKRRITPDFLKKQELAEALMQLMSAVCRAAPMGHETLAQELNFTPEFFAGCAANERITIGVQLNLRALYVELFLRGADIADTVSEKMRVMCFTSKDIPTSEDQSVSPLETASTNPVVRESIQSELGFWLSTEPDSTLARVLAMDEQPAKLAVWMLDYIRTHILAVKHLIEWRQVNDIFVYAVKKSLTVMLKTFDPTLGQHHANPRKADTDVEFDIGFENVELMDVKAQAESDRLREDDGEWDEVKVSHWSHAVMKFIFFYFRTSAETHMETKKVQKYWQGKSIKQALEVTDADANWKIGETYKELLTLYRLVIHWDQLAATRKTLAKMAQEPNWQAQVATEELKTAFVQKYSDFFAKLFFTSTKSKLLKYMQQHVDSSGGNASPEAPLLSSVGGVTSLFSAQSTSMIQKKWDLKDLLMQTLVLASDRYVKHSRDILHLLRLVTNPLQAFFDHFHKAVFIQETSLSSVQTIMNKFLASHVSLQSAEELVTLEPVIEALGDVCHMFHSVTHLVAAPDERRALYKRMQVVFSNLGLQATLRELWDLAALMDSKGFASEPTAIRLKTMILLTTHGFANGSPHIVEHVFEYMHAYTFFYDYPEFVELLGELKLLRAATHDTVNMLTGLMTDRLKSNPGSLPRIADCISLLYLEDGHVIPDNLEITAVVVSKSLESALSSESLNLAEIAAYLRLLARMATYSKGLKENLKRKYARLALGRVFESSEMPEDLIVALLEFAATVVGYDANVSAQGSGPWLLGPLLTPLFQTLKNYAALDPAAVAALPLTPEAAQSTAAKCARNLCQNDSLLRFLYALDRSGKPVGFLVSGYGMLNTLDISNESRGSDFVDALQALTANFSRLLAEVPTSSNLTPLVLAYYETLKTLKTFWLNETNFQFLQEFGEGLTSALQTVPEDLQLLALTAPQVTEVAEFCFNHTLEDRLALFLHILPSLAKTTDDHYSAIFDFFRDFLGVGKGHEFVDNFIDNGLRTIRIFEEGKDPSVDLRIKYNMIQGMDGGSKRTLYESPQFFDFIDKRILRAIRSPRKDVRRFALQLFNEVLTHQSERFKLHILMFLTNRQRYNEVFFRLVDAVSVYIKEAFKPTGNKEHAIEVQLHADYLKQYLIFVQLCCDNCFEPFQSFMEVQHEGGTSNHEIVSSLRDMITNVWTLENIKKDLPSHCLDVSLETIRALKETVSGPNLRNQALLGKSKNLYSAVNNILKYCHKHFIDTCGPLEKDLYEETLALLDTLLEGHDDASVYVELMKTHLDCEALFLRIGDMHTRVAEVPPHDLFGNAVIPSQAFELGRHIMIILLQIAKRADCTLIDLLPKPGRLLNPAELFFLSYVSAVQIQKSTEDGTQLIYTAFFPLPVESNFLTARTSKQVISDIKRTSQQEKVESFIKLRLPIRKEMEHQMKISKFSAIKNLSKWWQEISYASFALIVIINLLLLSEFGVDESGSADSRTKLPALYHLALMILGSLQVVCIFFGRLFYWVEYGHILWYPLFVERAVTNTKEHYTNPINKTQDRIRSTQKYREIEKQILDAEAKRVAEEQQKAAVRSATIALQAATTSQRAEEVDGMVDENAEMGSDDLAVILAQTVPTAVVDPCPPLQFNSVVRVVWHIIYIALCAFAVVLPQLYPLLLLELASLNPDMNNILKAVTKNYKQLVLTGLFTLSIVFIFTMWGYADFHHYYSNGSNLYCETLFDCFFSTLNVGVRTGAISDPMDPYELPDYYPRMVFDMLFFIIVIVILLNIVFGIIVDTFGQLRDERNEIEDDINNVCFICGIDRGVIDVHGEEGGWEEHITTVHPPFAYMAFFHYLETKRLEDCSGLEKYVKQELIRKTSNFIPTTSEALLKEDITSPDSS